MLADGFLLSSTANELIQQAAENQYYIEQVRKLKAEALVDRDLIYGSNPLARPLGRSALGMGVVIGCALIATNDAPSSDDKRHFLSSPP